MHAKYLLINECSNREAVKTVCECFPQFDIVSSLTFIIEPIDSIDGGAFMVASEEEEVLRVLDLISQQQAHCLKTLLSSVYIVSQEEVVGIGWEPTVFE